MAGDEDLLVGDRRIDTQGDEAELGLGIVLGHVRDEEAVVVGVGGAQEGAALDLELGEGGA
jgi:hypothetical protein